MGTHSCSDSNMGIDLPDWHGFGGEHTFALLPDEFKLTSKCRLFDQDGMSLSRSSEHVLPFLDTFSATSIRAGNSTVPPTLHSPLF